MTNDYLTFPATCTRTSKLRTWSWLVNALVWFASCDPDTQVRTWTPTSTTRATKLLTEVHILNWELCDVTFGLEQQ
jgi:hypothetical protein